MVLPTSLTTVTRLSKTIALVLFIALPFVGFMLGVKWQTTLTNQNPQAIVEPAFHRTPSTKEKVASISADTTDWQTYTFTKYGYTIRYPTNMYIIESTSDDQSLFLSNKNPEEKKKGSDYSIFVYISENALKDKGNLTPEQFLDKYYSVGSATKATAFMGRPAIKTQEEPYNPKTARNEPIITYFIIDKSNLIKLEGSTNSLYTTPEALDKILSTFRFE